MKWFSIAVRGVLASVGIAERIVTTGLVDASAGPLQ